MAMKPYIPPSLLGNFVARGIPCIVRLRSDDLVWTAEYNGMWFRTLVTTLTQEIKLERDRIDMAEITGELRHYYQNGYRDVEVVGYAEQALAILNAPAQPLTGPHAAIRELREREDDHYDAYDKDGNLLSTLTPAGARRVMDAEPVRVRVVSL